MDFGLLSWHAICAVYAITKGHCAMRTIVISVRVLLLVLFIAGCSKDSSDPGSPDASSGKMAVVTENEAVQNAAYQKFTALLSGMDTVAARDSIVRLLRKDVQHIAKVNGSRQGITITYTSGMRGGFFLNGNDAGDNGPAFTPVRLGKVAGVRGAGATVVSLPSSKKVLFINPHYYERGPQAQKIYTYLNQSSILLDMETPTVYLSDSATVDRFTTLSQYGIIHVYSHGMAWPDEDTIEEVMLMTGEKVTPGTSVRDVDDITSGDIPLMIAGNVTRYFVSPAFIIRHNTGADGTALFYGGFCYSNLGTWPLVITGQGLANTYTGFSWSVYTDWNATWAAHLYWYLADTSQADGMTVAGWHGGTASMAKSYYNTEQNRWVEIGYTGGQFALWQALKITSLSPVSGPVGTAVAITGTGFGASRGQRTVTLNAGALTPSSWSDTQIGVTIPPGAVSGDIVVHDGKRSSDPAYFTVTGATADTAVIAQLRTTKTVTITVNARFAFSDTTMGTRDTWGVSYDDRAKPLQWSGTGFSVANTVAGTFDSTRYTFSGTFSADGRTLQSTSGKSVTYYYTGKKVQTTEISVMSVPYCVYCGGVTYNRAGTAGAGSVSKISFTETVDGKITNQITTVTWDPGIYDPGVTVQFHP